MGDEMLNHYAPPQSDVDDVAPRGQGITGNMIETMRGTKGWVLLIGILTMIGAAFMVLGAIGMMVGGIFMGAVGTEGPPAAMMAGMGAAYLVMAVVYIFPAWYLLKYASSIGRFVSTGGVGDLEEALHQQRRFWKFVGVLAIVMMILFVLGMIAAVAIPVFIAGARGGF